MKRRSRQLRQQGGGRTGQPWKRDVAQPVDSVAAAGRRVRAPRRRHPAIKRCRVGPAGAGTPVVR